MAIYSHACLGARDLEVSRKFYDAVLATLGIDNLAPMDDSGYFYGKDSPEFVVMKPANGEPATPANGGTLSFLAETRAQVRAFHATGLAAGATDEGGPGARGFPPNAYSAYMRDPIGNKICTYCFAEGE
jgi:catechol 2,3-dioxygenase-like lactoylglutathione lyase family enzyme